jgi:hypothetical protein
MPSSSSFSHRHARASALTSVLSGWGLAPRQGLATVGSDDALATPSALEQQTVSIAGALTVSLLSAPARYGA